MSRRAVLRLLGTFSSTVLLLAAVAACDAAGGAVRSPSGPASRLVTADETYAEGRTLEVRVPGSGGSGLPAVVLLHGCCGDRSDVVKLAEAVAADGAVVFTPDWGGTGRDGRFPTAYEDVGCAVRYARAHAAGHGEDPARVVLAGWSDGAMAAAAVAASGAILDAGRCVEQRGSAHVDALVGLAGYYGWTLPVPTDVVTARAVRFIGGTPDAVPAAWASATPYSWLDCASPIPATLLTGSEDPLREQTERFHAALVRAGWPARLVLVPYDGEPSLLSPRTAEGRRAADETVAAGYAVPSSARSESTAPGARCSASPPPPVP